VVVAIAATLALTSLRGPEAGAVRGGKAVAIEAAPWTVAIMEALDGRQPRLWCTGVIISRTEVVTAAHCLRDQYSDLPVTASRLSVRAGVANATHHAEGDALQTRRVMAIRFHPDHSATDIAVIRLSAPLSLHRGRVEPIALARSPTWRAGEKATIAGFGQEYPNRAPSGSLHVARQKADAQGSCGRFTLGSPASALEICASAQTVGVCRGDSGAGLVSTSSPPRLLGILEVLYGPNCRPGTVAGYDYVGAGEIQRFLRGDRRPPLAPRAFNLVVWTTLARVGDRLACVGLGTKHTRTRYQVFVGDRSVRASTTPIRYTVARRDVGMEIRCVGTATNAGGTVRQTWHAEAVRP
jgi:hypothetical protein